MATEVLDTLAIGEGSSNWLLDKAPETQSSRNSSRSQVLSGNAFKAALSRL
ncbi:MAG: hypothetical protein HC769_30435 [Cyanobacteria bacterium CRU_2_1]|nr:hypothetical protein [Cyanobacteria bacterium CRU_2_1]